MGSSSFSSWFRGIKGQLLFAAVLPVIGFTILFGISLRGLNKEDEVITTAHESLVPNLDVTGTMRSSRNKFGYQALYTINVYDNTEQRNVHLEEMRGAIKDYQTSYDLYQKAPFLPGENEMHEKSKGDIADMMAVMSDVTKLLESGDAQKVKQARELLDGQFATVSGKAQKFVLQVNKLYRDTAAAQAEEAKVTRSNVVNLVVLVAVLASLLTFGILTWLAHKVSTSVSSISNRLTSAAGDVAASVEQLSEAGNSLSSASTEAAASLEETVASLEEMTSMVKLGSDNAKQAAQLANSSRDAAETGAREIQNLIQSMNQISTSSKKIEEIISVIDDIAFQTNLLALNAAVEAARAGEQGKGFAVVAEAVRTLAQRSAASAKDISSLIKDSVEQIQHGSETADKSGAILSNIVDSIKKVSDLNSDIASASQDQATGIEQINKAMSQLDQAGQSNAASAEEIAATTGEISSLATTAQNLTVELNAVVLGGNSGVLPSTPVKSAPVKKNDSGKASAAKVIPLGKAEGF